MTAGVGETEECEMSRLSRSVVVAASVAVMALLVPTAALAQVARKPLPKDGCDLVDIPKLEAALGVSTSPPTGESAGVAAGCLVPIPYDPSTCIVQPAPAVIVAVAPATSFGGVSLKEAAALASQQDFEVRPLKGKAYGKKGAFLSSGGTGWTFYGLKGTYGIQVKGSEPCGSVSLEQMAAAVQVVAKSAIKQL